MNDSLRERAEKAIDLIEKWDELFPNNKREHLITTLMTAIEDAYRQGVSDTINSRKDLDEINKTKKGLKS